MRNMRAMRQMNLPNRQAGFIQNFIIPGIILIGVVIAGIAMLSSGSSTNTDNERASMLANVVVTQGLTVTTAVQRAEADGALAAAGDAAARNAALVNGRYITSGAMPTLPPDLASAGAWGFEVGVFQAVGSAGADIGSGTKDDVLVIELGPQTDGMTEAVCLRINNKLYQSSTVTGTAVGTYAAAKLTAPTGTNSATGAEGCVGNGTDLFYYKVVNVK